MPVVITNIKRAERAATDALAGYGVATVHEAMGRVGLMAPRMRPIWRGPAISGTAVTALCPPGDNWMIHVAVEQCQPGDILVVAPVSLSESGYFGDLLGTSLKAQGVRGVILDAGCRDIDDLEKMGFPVWSACVSAHGCVKETLGDVNVAISCGGQTVNPGDVIVADSDGVVVVPRLAAPEVVKAAQARIDREAKSRARYAAGELGLDVNQMRGRLVEKELSYIDQAAWEARR